MRKQAEEKFSALQQNEDDLDRNRPIYHLLHFEDVTNALAFRSEVVNNGYVITDNLDFHGLVAHPEKTKNKNTKDLVRKISRFRQYLSEREDYDTTFYTFGDGVAISKKL